MTADARAASDGQGRCAWCGRRFPLRSGPGRPRRFCRRSCRQRNYEAQRRAAELGIGERELVLARSELDGLWDQLWVLECAIEDTERDLADSPTLAEYRRAVAWLLEAARPLLSMRLG